MTATRFDPDELAHLEEERDFLLRSLDDLERERAEGNVEGDEYDRLKDDYTARAAAVIRAIRDGLDARPVAPPASPRRRIAVGVGIVVFALLAGALLARSLGERLPGATATGNDQLADTSTAADAQGICPVGAGALDDLEAEAGDGPGARMAYAGALLEAGRAADALREYDRVVGEAPGAAEPFVCSSQIVFAAGLADDALSRLDAAVAAEPDFAPAFYVRGLFRFQADGDAEGAVVDLERALELAPDGPFAEAARVAIDEIRRPGEGAGPEDGPESHQDTDKEQ